MDQILLGRYIPWWLNFYTGGVPPLCCGGQGLPEPHSCSRPLQPGAAGPRTGRAPLLRLNWSGLMVSPTVLPTRNSLSQNASGIPTEKCQFRGTLFFFFLPFSMSVRPEGRVTFLVPKIYTERTGYSYNRFWSK